MIYDIDRLDLYHPWVPEACGPYCPLPQDHSVYIHVIYPGGIDYALSSEYQ